MDRTLICRWTIACACLSLNGCTVCELALRTMRYEPAAYSWKHDKVRSRRLYRTWAEEAWQLEQQGCQDSGLSQEFGMGFRDGFVDYVYAGGTGEPPPVPPRRFWNASLRSPEGQQLAQQWFNGYRRGAQVARDGGYRSMATIHSSLMGMDPQFNGEPLENYVPDESNFQEHSPFEDDLPIPDSAPRPEAAAQPSQDEAEIESKELNSKGSARAQEDSVPSADSSQGEPQGNKLPEIDSQPTPEGAELPSERRIAPPLEDLRPATEGVPEMVLPEAQNRKSTIPRSTPKTVADVDATPAGLILVQHWEPSQTSELPNELDGRPKPSDVRFIDRTAPSAPVVPLSSPQSSLPSSGSSTLPNSTEDNSSRQTGLRFVADGQPNQESASKAKPGSSKRTESLLKPDWSRVLQPSMDTERPAYRDFAR